MQLQICTVRCILHPISFCATEPGAGVSHLPPDNELLQNVKDSDMEAFRMLFERYQPFLFRHVLFQTQQSDLSHDIVQETFIRVWEHRASLKPSLSFLSFALRISGNLIRDVVRYRKTREKLESEIPRPFLSERDDPAEALHVKVLREAVVEAINTALPNRCRTIFLLSRFEGKTNREIGELLGLSVRTVEHQIGHALKVLRKKLRWYL